MTVSISITLFAWRCHHIFYTTRITVLNESSYLSILHLMCIVPHFITF